MEFKKFKVSYLVPAKMEIEATNIEEAEKVVRDKLKRLYMEKALSVEPVILVIEKVNVDDDKNED